MNINGMACIFIPMELYLGNDFMPIPRHLKKNGTAIHWYVNRKYVSYNQIRECIFRYYKKDVEK